MAENTPLTLSSKTRSVSMTGPGLILFHVKKPREKMNPNFNQPEKDSITLIDVFIGAVAVVAFYVLAVMLFCF